MIIPEYIQVALDAIEEEDSFALEAEHQLVEWLEEIESGYKVDNNFEKSWSRCEFDFLSRSESGSWSWSLSQSLSWYLFDSMSQSKSGFKLISWSKSGSK